VKPAPRLIFITHPEVIVAPEVDVPEWHLSDTGRQRARTLGESAMLSGVSAIWSSSERKARETASILADALGLIVDIDPRLGENDRGSTGYLPSDRFEDAANRFFASPNESHHGWERATDAQVRICSAVKGIAGQHVGGDLAVVSHGAVGTLLWCAFTDNPIDRRFDQPSQGHLWQADLRDLRPDSGWRSYG
jgi:broad specificity phosphatase PhoE